MMAINKSLLLLCYLLLGAAVLLIGVDPSEEKSIVFHTDFDSTDSRLVLYYNGSAAVERLFTINSDDVIKAFIDKEEMNIRLDGLSEWIDPNSFLATVIQPEEEEQQKVEVVGVSVAGGNQKVNMSEKPKEKSHYLMFKEKSYSKVSDDSELKKGMKDKLLAEQRAVQKKIASYEKMLKQIEESKFEAGQFEEKLKLVDSLVEMIAKNLVSLDDLKEKLQAIGKSPSQPSMYFEFSSKVPEFIKLNPKPFTLKIKYIIKSERFYWSPQYLLSVDSKSQTGQLMFMANVVQKTGENFTNALVELSTDSLGQAPGLPQLDVLTLDQTGIYRHLRDTNTVHSFAKRMMGSSSYIGSMPNNQQRNYQNAFNDGNTESVQADQNSQVTTDVIKSSTSFIIADRTSFITDSSEGYKSVSMLIAKINLESKWYHKVIPKQSSKVYTIMAIKNKSKYQLIPGDVNVFINNVLSTQSRIRSDVFPDDIFQIDIGIDRMVSVKINDKNKNEEESGWFSKTNTIIESSQITIENKKDVPINITVIDALPYTENWHVDDKLQIILTQPKNDQGKDIDLHEIFIPKPTADGKETIYQTEYQFNTKVGKKDMKCKIKKRNHSLERNFNISSKESIVLPLTYQMCVSK